MNASPARRAETTAVRSLAWDTFDSRRWDEIVRACNGANWFQTAGWMELLTRSFPGWEGRVLAAEGDDGVVRGILPFVRVHHYGVQSALSMPFGTSGGPLVPAEDASAPKGVPWREDADPGEVAAALCRTFVREALTWNCRGGQITESGHQGMRDLPPADLLRFQRGASQRMVLDLRGGIEEVRAQRFQPQRRRQARSAHRRGLVVGLARGENDFLEFAELYAQVSRIWNSRCRLPRAFFMEVPRTRSARVVLLLARHQGQLVAGNLAFLHREGAFSWCGVMQKDHRDLHPAVALHEETIALACAAGCLTYDLGPSPALPRVEGFKREFGAERRSFTSWTVLSPLGRVIERARPALLRATRPRDGGPA